MAIDTNFNGTGELINSSYGDGTGPRQQHPQYTAYIVRMLRIGPERDHPQWDAEAQADDGALVPGVNGAVLANGNVRV